jgi:hypothetical protein
MEQLITPLSRDKDLALLEFTKTKINSFIKWELVKFFYYNAATGHTVENVARCIGRKTDAVQPELEDLVGNDILEKKVLADKTVYTLTTKEPALTLVDQFILAGEDRFFRIKAVEQIVLGMS